MCRGAATSGQFISPLPPVEISFRRGKSDGCWGVASTRKRTKHTRSAVKVECLRCRTLYTPLPRPFPPALCSRLFWIQFSIKLAVDKACPFELVMRARDKDAWQRERVKWQMRVWRTVEKKFPKTFPGRTNRSKGLFRKYSTRGINRGTVSRNLYARSCGML